MPMPKDPYVCLVGSCLSLFRRERRLSQTELARSCNKHQNRLSLWEVGRTCPSMRELHDVLAAMGVPVSKFVLFVEAMHTLMAAHYAEWARDKYSQRYIDELAFRRGLVDRELRVTGALRGSTRNG